MAAFNPGNKDGSKERDRTTPRTPFLKRMADMEAAIENLRKNLHSVDNELDGMESFLSDVEMIYPHPALLNLQANKRVLVTFNKMEEGLEEHTKILHSAQMELDKINLQWNCEARQIKKEKLLGLRQAAQLQAAEAGSFRQPDEELDEETKRTRLDQLKRKFYQVQEYKKLVRIKNDNLIKRVEVYATETESEGGAGGSSGLQQAGVKKEVGTKVKKRQKSKRK